MSQSLQDGGWGGEKKKGPAWYGMYINPSHMGEACSLGGGKREVGGESNI